MTYPSGATGFRNPGLVTASKVIIIGPKGELLVYNPTEATNNLVASISGVPITDDGFGNQSPGPLGSIADYSHIGGDYRSVALTQGAVQFWFSLTGENGWSLAGGFSGDSGVFGSSPFIFGQSVGGYLFGDAGERNGIAVLFPSGDVTGTKDRFLINFCFDQGYNIVLGPGAFYVDHPIKIPPHMRLQGPQWPGIDPSPNAILPSATFNELSVISFVDQATGGYSTLSQGQSLIDINIDGTLNGGFSSGTVDAIHATGLVHGVTLERVSMYNIGGHGFAVTANGSGTPHTWRFINCSANTTGNVGFSPGQMTDSYWADCEAINCGNRAFASGFFIIATPNSHFVGCRAEFNNLYGLQIEGAISAGNGSGPLVFDGFSTDRNQDHGVYLNATGTTPIELNNLQCRRDGSLLPVGAAGVLIQTTHTAPTVINDIITYPGPADDGSGSVSPFFGVNILNGGAGWVQINGGFLWGVTAGLGGTPSNMRGVSAVAGTNTAPGPIVPLPDMTTLPWQVVGTATPFLNSFTAGGTAPRYQIEGKNGGRVRLSGAVNTGAINAANTPMFNLPVAYRPSRQLGFVTPNNIAAAVLGQAIVQVNTTGDVLCVPASTAGKFLLLDGIVFELD